MDFDLNKFNKENPILEVGETSEDPFVERVNGREHSDKKGCWCCKGSYYSDDGATVGDADENGEEVSSFSDLCKSCRALLKISGYIFT